MKFGNSKMPGDQLNATTNTHIDFAWCNVTTSLDPGTKGRARHEQCRADQDFCSFLERSRQSNVQAVQMDRTKVEGEHNSIRRRWIEMSSTIRSHVNKFFVCEQYGSTQCRKLTWRILEPLISYRIRKSANLFQDEQLADLRRSA